MQILFVFTILFVITIALRTHARSKKIEDNHNSVYMELRKRHLGRRVPSALAKYSDHELEVLANELMKIAEKKKNKKHLTNSEKEIVMRFPHSFHVANARLRLFSEKL